MGNPYTREQRSELIELVRTGRATVSEAAARLGVPSSTAYYWMKQAGARGQRRKGRSARSPRKAEGGGAPRFVQLVHSGDLDTAITVRVGEAELEVRREFDGELLRTIVAALSEGAG